MASLVENGLFWIPSIFVFAPATRDGEASSRRPTPDKAAAPATAALARNFLRFRYKLFGVISDDLMSGAFLISIGHLLCQEYAAPRGAGFASSSIFCQIRRIWRWKVAFGRKVGKP